ncbi:MAG: ribosomal protein S18-alanine N-acetyltransferase [Candidatus Bathyarchaeia archaeon]|nr:ribosomal protein S18-alanine N-acetyltransferase [Candidatus Bathyarchaeota archaeon]
MSSIRVRYGCIRDLDDIREVETLSFGDESYPRDLLSYLLMEGNTLIVEYNGRVVGYISYICLGSKAHILSIAIHPGYRRMGLGGTLLREAIDDMKRLGIRKVLLEVRVDNDAAIRLYSKAGFKIHSILKGYYNGRDGYLMVMDIR